MKCYRCHKDVDASLLNFVVGRVTRGYVEEFWCCRACEDEINNRGVKSSVKGSLERET